MLKDKLQDELKTSLKSGDSVRRLTLGMVLAAVKNKELEKRNKLSKTGVAPDQLESQSVLNDDEVLEVVASEVKKRKESIETYTKGDRPELAEKEQTELQILMELMPQQLSEEEVRAEVKKTIAAVKPQGVKDMGKVIGQVMPHLKGRADGQTVSRIVKEELSTVL